MPFQPEVSLADFGLTAAARDLALRLPGLENSEARYLAGVLERLPEAEPGDETVALATCLATYMEAPQPQDEPLIKLGTQLGLNPVELVSLALVAAVEFDAMAGRVVAFLQAPVGGSRPTLGLLASLLEDLAPSHSTAFDSLLHGVALSCGLLAFDDERAPLPERALVLPQPLLLALRGGPAAWPDAVAGTDDLPPVPLPPSVLELARRHADALRQAPDRGLVIRTPSPLEGRWVAALVCRELGYSPLFLGGRHIAGLTPFLMLQGLLPVFCADLAPGERETLPALPHYAGPVLAVCGVDGALDTAAGTPMTWRLTVPEPAERSELWRRALPGNQALAETLGRNHRHSAGRIAYLGRLAQHESDLRAAPALWLGDVLTASWGAEALNLEAFAEPMPQAVTGDALVLPSHTRSELELLIQRCRARDGIADGLGASIKARYHPGVRALFTGPSGAGKTLAAGWLATALGMPLYRVDASAVVSKYIGETEKNLAQLLAHAEQSDVIIVFDEADAFFGKRTDVKEANDRFANSQTNFLLQRIESFDGITVLTSNSRSRFDSAFTRRLDAIIEFAAPGPEERRALWLSHLGNGHRLTPKQINQLAAAADLGGGHIRNAVLTAAVLAHDPPRPIGFADVLEGVAAEYRKLGRRLPAELTGSGVSTAAADAYDDGAAPEQGRQ